MRTKYRDKLGIYRDMLLICENPETNNPTITSYIFSRTNVDHKLGTECFMTLGEAGLIEPYKSYLSDSRRHVKYKVGFRTSAKGKEFLRLFSSVEKSMEPVRDFVYGHAYN